MEDKLMLDEYGFGYNENELFESRWLDIVKTDHDYDGDFLIRIITHKLRLMKNYFANFMEDNDGAIENDVSILKIIKTINTAYDLGIRILTFNYGEAADKIFEEKGNPRWLIESSEEEDYKEWDRLSEEATENRKKDISKFFRVIGKNIDNWYR